ncbi:MAG: SDR family oxidoreductase [Bacteroidales bacterium]|nr:SDR family oxidoreductase [Bacteroidales bacterium]
MNKTALITGASKGIGFELARIHASRGDNLILVARNKNKLDELKRELEKKYAINVYTIGKDLSLRSSAREVYDDVKRNGISVDYLINNAGFGDFGLFADCDWDKQEKMINLNITALIHLTRLFLPGMIEKEEGKILNMASTAAFQPGPTMSVYFASKAFVLSFSEAINNEVRDKGITVTALCPGSTDTNFHAIVLDDPKLVKYRKMASPKEVAEYGYRAMMKGKPLAIQGFKNSLMANAVRFFPRGFIVKIVRKIQEKKHFRKI